MRHEIRICSILLASILITSGQVNGQSYGSTKDERVRAAVMAAPADLRAEATVLGYDARGNTTTLRRGKNNMVCLADDPAKEGFGVACYHRDLDPFMARGRQLRAEGRSTEEIRAARKAEVEAGTLKMPDHPSTLYVLSGKTGRLNAKADSVEGATLRFVVYVPYATTESLGLPASPTGPGEPWLMDPGTHRAHIMITP